MEEIKVKYFTDDIDELCYVEGKSDWIDLHAAETVTMKAGEFRLIPLGVAIALPAVAWFHWGASERAMRHGRPLPASPALALIVGVVIIIGLMILVGELLA